MMKYHIFQCHCTWGQKRDHDYSIDVPTILGGASQIPFKEILPNLWSPQDYLTYTSEHSVFSSPPPPLPPTIHLVLFCFGCAQHLFLGLLIPVRYAAAARDLLVTLGRCWEVPSHHCQCLPSVIEVAMSFPLPMLPWSLPQCTKTILFPYLYAVNLSSVFILNLVLSVCIFGLFLLGHVIMGPRGLGLRKIWLTGITLKIFPPF